MPSSPFNRTFAAPRPSASPARITLGRPAATALAAAVALSTLWAGAATWFILARDDLAQRVFANEAELRYGYEDRLKAMKDQLERAVTQHLVERNAVGSRLDILAKRQAEIEDRQRWLRQLAEHLPGSARVESARLSPRGGIALPPASSAYTANPAADPLPEPFALRLHEPSPAAIEAEPPRDRLSALEGAASATAAEEIALIDGLRGKAQERLAMLRTAIGATGLNPDRERTAKPVGGPLVPLPQSRAGVFGPLAAELSDTVEELNRTLAMARSLPLGRPLAGDMEMTSPFGYRLDPFTRGAALHTGADFRAEYGAPVHAAAGGRITVAEYTGGYGNMVEIDHGGGVATRYGHLSAYAVPPGTRVEAGEVIGYAGSTGRSTGSHLHYETRINGEPVNPVRFLEAGTHVAPLLTASN